MSQLSYISSLSVSFISVSPQLYFSSLFLISGLFLSILVLSTPLLRLTIYVEALQFVLHPLEPPIRFPVPPHCSLSSPQLPTRISYTSPPHRSGGYALRSTPSGPSIRSPQAPQLPLVRLPSPVSALSHTSSYGLGSYCIRLGPVWDETASNVRTPEGRQPAVQEPPPVDPGMGQPQRRYASMGYVQNASSPMGGFAYSPTWGMRGPPPGPVPQLDMESASNAGGRVSGQVAAIEKIQGESEEPLTLRQQEKLPERRVSPAAFEQSRASSRTIP
ncbi:hypothetical protein GG344DRAFT_82939 [Lentinula edodes]|nr:hypothetical protein GG344DRAFT_82939 [Lentinula edodes]